MSRLLRLWRALPAIVRSIILGELVVTIGVLPPELAVVANLRWIPSVPWLLLPAALWLWLYWRYLNGWGWPRSTAEARKDLLRAPAVPPPLFLPAIVAGALGLAAALTLGLLTVTLAHTPAAAFRLPIDFGRYPWWTVAACVAAISVTAGIVEEAGFRGYMVTEVQRRHGWTVASIVSGAMFFFDHHLSHAYATWAYVPFFVGISAVHVLLVRCSGSIRPSIVLHAAFDLMVTPVMFGVLGRRAISPASGNIALECGALVILTAASIPAFRFLLRRGRRGLA